MHTCVVAESLQFRSALTALLENTDFPVSSGARSLAEAANITRSFDQVILLVQNPGERRALAGQIELLKSSPVPPWIVLLASALDAAEMAESFACGVDGYLLEDITRPALIKSLKLVTLGVKVFPSQIARLMIGSQLRDRDPGGAKIARGGVLSDREAEVANWLMRGTPNKVIARHMSITDATVKVHVKNILKKVGLNSRTQLAVWAMQEGLQERGWNGAASSQSGPNGATPSPTQLQAGEPLEPRR